MENHNRFHKVRKAGPKRLILKVAGMLILVGALAGAAVYRNEIRLQMGKVAAYSGEETIPVLSLEGGPIELNVQANGEIVGLGSVPVSAPGTGAGSLKLAWLISEGEMAVKGSPVIRFDSTDQRLELEAQTNALNQNLLQSKVDTGDQQLDETTLALDRKAAAEDYEYTMAVLPEDETIYSQWEIIIAKLDADLAKSKIENLDAKAKTQKLINLSRQQEAAIAQNQVQAEVDIIQRTLAALGVNAPSDGLVVYRRERRQDPKIGDSCQAGQVLIDLVDLNALQARIYVLEREGGGLAKGKSVTLKLDALPDKELHGEVSAVSPVAATLERNSPLKYFTCDVTIRDARPYMRLIKPGMTLQASVILEKYDSGFMVPASAVDVREDKSYVYVKQGQNFVQREVQVGLGKHGQATILGGVKDEELIALKNPFETRQLQLPDFSKASGAAQDGRGGMMPTGPRGGGRGR